MQTEQLNHLLTQPQFKFGQFIAFIDQHYQYQPTAFRNGDLQNDAGQNEGSCKLFFFAKLHQLSAEKTLKCFGEHYATVLDTPEGDSHQNIRNFMKHGWEGIQFNGIALSEKS